MQDSKNSSLEVLVPRALVGCGERIAGANVTGEGLCSLKINLKDGFVANIEPIENPNNHSLEILLPRLVESHAHIDKAFTWKNFPNLAGTYAGALEANLKELQLRTKESVLMSAEKALSLSVRNGFRALRSHVDSLGTSADKTWQVLLGLKDEWKELIHLELVALVPLNYWNTQEGNSLARKVASEGECLGGVLTPPFKEEEVRNDLQHLCRLANELGCGLDLHIDESSQEPGAGLKQLLYVLDLMQLDVPITCSHLSSLGLLKPRLLEYFSNKLLQHQINVIALPLTNAWLLGRSKGFRTIKRSIAPISQLQNAGVNVAIGGDNVQDPWFPGGDFDPLMLMAFSMPITQLAPWNRFGIAPFTTAPSRIMDLEWDGTIDIGSPADFILLEANTWSEALFLQPKRKIIIKGKFLEENFFEVDKRRNDLL